MEKNVDKTLYKNYDKNLLLFESANSEKIRFLNKVNEYRKNINRDKFIIIIKWVLSFLIIYNSNLLRWIKYLIPIF